jgi:hypothetical protein
VKTEGMNPKEDTMNMINPKNLLIFINIMKLTAIHNKYENLVKLVKVMTTNKA